MIPHLDLATTLYLSLIAHLVGDYLLQSHWMATHKVAGSAGTGESWLAAIAHGITYGLPYLAITISPVALAVIVGTHILIDHYRLARHVVWAKNWLGPGNRSWRESSRTGYPADVPAGLATALLIVADNTVHLLINTTALIATH